MRIIRVKHNGQTFYASLGEGAVISLNPQHARDTPIPLAEVALMPLVLPSKIICITLNYRDRAAELEMPVPQSPPFILRPNSSLLANSQPVRLPSATCRMYPEASLAIVIGQGCRRIRPEDAPRHIFGFTCANDISMYSGGGHDLPGTAEKASDGTCCVGPWLETHPPDSGRLRIRSMINGALCQDGSTRDMIFSPEELLSHLSHIMTLNPGDVILTGTPSGACPARPGDTVQVEIPGVGVISNPVAEEEEPLSLPMQ